MCFMFSAASHAESHSDLRPQAGNAFNKIIIIKKKLTPHFPFVLIFMFINVTDAQQEFNLRHFHV